jgi:hypothetical protein
MQSGAGIHSELRIHNTGNNNLLARVTSVLKSSLENEPRVSKLFLRATNWPLDPMTVPEFGITLAVSTLPLTSDGPHTVPSLSLNRRSTGHLAAATLHVTTTLLPAGPYPLPNAPCSRP